MDLLGDARPKEKGSNMVKESADGQELVWQKLY
jgi:hypothetical protein